MEETFGLLSLPNETLVHVFTFIPVVASVRAALMVVCQAFRKFALPEEVELDKYKGYDLTVKQKLLQSNCFRTQT